LLNFALVDLSLQSTLAFRSIRRTERQRAARWFAGFGMPRS
jgi:hypothetical protein